LTKLEGLEKRVDSLEPASKPRNQRDNFSAQRLASEMQETLDYLTETYGPSILTDQYRKDHSPSVLALIRKAEASNCANAGDFIRELSEDEQEAFAHLIVKVEKAAETRNPLRSTFVQAFGAKSN
jgi:hypothetical protein